MYEYSLFMNELQPETKPTKSKIKMRDVIRIMRVLVLSGKFYRSQFSSASSVRGYSMISDTIFFGIAFPKLNGLLVSLALQTL